MKTMEVLMEGSISPGGYDGFTSTGGGDVPFGKREVALVGVAEVVVLGWDNRREKATMQQ